MVKTKNVLVVDDEPNIQKSIRSILESKGFQTSLCADPLQVEGFLKQNPVDLVLLDIWMPGMDGHTLLKIIKAFNRRLPVIIMSGHASVHTGIEVAKNGADDFLEKPFASELLLSKIRTHLRVGGGENADFATEEPHPYARLLKRVPLKQRTLKKSGVLKGKGLHSGESTGIILSPLPPDSGIVFEDISAGGQIKAWAKNVHSTSFATNLTSEGSSVICVEHLLSALHAYGVDNALIKVNKEIPILDGSSLPFCDLIESCGVAEQGLEKKMIVIDRVYECVDTENPNKVLRIEPADDLEIDYHLELPPGFGDQHYLVKIPGGDVETYKKEIAPARTFGFLEELKSLQSAGFGQGGDLENFLLLDQDRVINTRFRFPEEPARHKILDVIGDLYLMGAPVRGKVTAMKTGHRHTIALLKVIAAG